MPLVQSQWAWNLSWGCRSSSLASGGAVCVSHTDTTPSVSPLIRYLPELHGDVPSVPVASGFRGGEDNLRVQVEVDALVGGDVPLHSEQNVVRFPQVPA